MNPLTEVGGMVAEAILIAVIVGLIGTIFLALPSKPAKAVREYRLRIAGNPTVPFRKALEKAIYSLPPKAQEAIVDVGITVSQHEHITDTGETNAEGMKMVWKAHGSMGIFGITIYEPTYWKKPWHNHSLHEDLRRTLMHEIGHAMGLNEDHLSHAGL